MQIVNNKPVQKSYPFHFYMTYMHQSSISLCKTMQYKWIKFYLQFNKLILNLGLNIKKWTYWIVNDRWFLYCCLLCGCCSSYSLALGLTSPTTVISILLKAPLCSGRSNGTVLKKKYCKCIVKGHKLRTTALYLTQTVHLTRIIKLVFKLLQNQNHDGWTNTRRVETSY